MRWSVEIIHSGAITLIRKRADRNILLSHTLHQTRGQPVVSLSQCMPVDQFGDASDWPLAIYLRLEGLSA